MHASVQPQVSAYHGFRGERKHEKVRLHVRANLAPTYLVLEIDIKTCVYMYPRIRSTRIWFFKWSSIKNLMRRGSSAPNHRIVSKYEMRTFRNTCSASDNYYSRKRPVYCAMRVSASSWSQTDCKKHLDTTCISVLFIIMSWQVNNIGQSSKRYRGQRDKASGDLSQEEC